MRSKLLVVVVILIVSSLVLGSIVGCGGSEEVNLVPAWLLTPTGMYSADSLLDPVFSWSPDSKSLLVSTTSSKTCRPWILRWKTGERQLDRVVMGCCPNYVDNDRFLFIIQNPVILMQHTLSSGADRVVIKDFRQVDFWKDITSLDYLPATKTLAVRFSNFTRYAEPGLQEIDLTGKPLRKLPRQTGNGVLDRSTDPEGKRVAEILGELSRSGRALRIAETGKTADGKEVATGELGAVAWSPDGKMIALADANDVKVMDPAGENTAVVARFAAKSGAAQAPYVCRLAWSPDSSYIAAVQVVPNETGANMMVYVLDMSKIKL